MSDDITQLVETELLPELSRFLAEDDGQSAIDAGDPLSQPVLNLSVTKDWLVPIRVRDGSECVAIPLSEVIQACEQAREMQRRANELAEYVRRYSPVTAILGQLDDHTRGELLHIAAKLSHSNPNPTENNT